MKISINGVVIETDDSELRGVNRKLDRILTRVGAMQAQERNEMTLVQDIQAKTAALQASVEAETAIDQSVVTLLNGQTVILADLRKQLADAIAANDSVALQAVVDALSQLEATNTAQSAGLAAAVVANTPVAPATPPAA